MFLARAFSLSLRDARELLSEPRVLPRDLEEGEARRLVEALQQQGVECEQVAVAGGSRASCGTHASLCPDAPCADCRVLVCVLCRDAKGEALCAPCATLRARRTRAKWLRVSVLLTVLVLLVLWGISRSRSREDRLRWDRPLEVSVVLLSRGEVTPEVRAAWRQGMGQLEEWLSREARRYRADALPPAHLSLAGPVSAAGVEFEPPGDSLLDRALHAWKLSRTLASVDEAAGVGPLRPDARIYVVLEPTREGGQRLVEGMGEEDGSVGLVHGPLEDTELTLALTAVAHELFHCLGARDAYDAQGHARVPEGLVEPGRQPLYPQPAAEVMVGEVPLGASEGRLPSSLDEVRVGPTTARALRWVLVAADEQ